MLDFTERKADCTGCSACLAACPVSCITMESDDEGFLYPVMGDGCIGCGKCERVCPIKNARAETDPDGGGSDFKKRAFCGLTRDDKVWRRSASGGAFSELCRAFGDDETLICGAAWDGFSVKHICVKGVNSIEKLCRSKYVASSPENTFREIERHLAGGGKAIFCGTPCQAAGLRAFLGRPYRELLIIDLICHGVGSPAVFDACTKEIGRQFGKTLTEYEFRAKRKVYETDHLTGLTFSDGSRIYATGDPYIQLFLSQTCLRPSCGKNCRFRTEHRQGDVTIADFKGLVEVFPELTGTKKNYSSIIINTPKGAELIPALQKQMRLTECGTDDIKRYNPLFYRQTVFSENRDLFFEEFRAAPDETVRKHTVPTKVKVQSLKGRLFQSLPTVLRKTIMNMMKGRK